MGFRGAAPVTQSSAVTNRLVEKHPLEYLQDGNFSDVPLMIGTNKHEGSFVLTSEWRKGRVEVHESEQGVEESQDIR